MRKDFPDVSNVISVIGDVYNINSPAVELHIIYDNFEMSPMNNMNFGVGFSTMGATQLVNSHRIDIPHYIKEYDCGHSEQVIVDNIISSIIESAYIHMSMNHVLIESMTGLSGFSIITDDVNEILKRIMHAVSVLAQINRRSSHRSFILMDEDDFYRLSHIPFYKGGFGGGAFVLYNDNYLDNSNNLFKEIGELYGTKLLLTKSNLLQNNIVVGNLSDLSYSSLKFLPFGRDRKGKLVYEIKALGNTAHFNYLNISYELLQ